MNDFLIKMVSKFSINKKNATNEDLENQITDENIKSELFDDDNQELKIIGIAALIIIGILVLVGILIFIFRKSIAEKFKILGETGAEIIEEFSSGDKHIISTLMGDESIDCSKSYDATYVGEYLINNQKVKETVTLLNGGVYTKATDSINVSVGNYSLNEKSLTFTETMYTGSPSGTVSYTISDDCKTLTRTLDGITVVLNYK